MPSIPHVRTRIGAAAMIVALALSACNAADASVQAVDPSVETLSVTTSATVAVPSTVDAEVALFDSGVVHNIDIEVDPDEYDEMITTYETTQEKDWIEATVTIDGTTFEDVGIRLKGNSSLRGVTAETAENPEDLHWLIRFDKYVDDQTYQGYGDLVIRSNGSETSLNEALALELLEEAGLATQEAIATRLTFNGGETELRLAIEHLDEIYVEANFDAEVSALYKADSTGDYSYRGEDPDAYDDVFDQKAGDDDLEPLIDFLDFINNSDDETFAAELVDWLDVEGFATYLAFQDLVGNFDDIDGPGNNSYLFYDYESEQFTVVNWDLNLAFGVSNAGDAAGGFGRPGAAPPDGVVFPDAGGEFPEGAVPPNGGGELPEGFTPPDGFARPEGAGGPGGVGGPGGFGDNPLVDRFMENSEFAQLYDEATSRLTESLFADGTATEILNTWVDVLSDQAADIVDAATIEADAAAVMAALPEAK